MAATMPAAEVEVTPELVQRLLAEQHPELADLPLTPLANGWDNVLYRLGEEFVVRLPRRELAVKCVLAEQRWLPVLAPGLSLPVPSPVRVGGPSAQYPWPWSVVEYRPGVPACDAESLDVPAVAGALGEFLGGLHVPAPPSAPRNEFRGVPLADRRATFAESLPVLGDAVDRPAALAVWDDALAAPEWSDDPVWLHGDLHPANLLVQNGRISAVLDFGDLTGGDPAGDLSVAWMLWPRSCDPEFAAAYTAAGGPPVDDAMRRRARGWALAFAVMYLAHSADNPQLHGIGERTLAAVLADA